MSLSKKYLPPVGLIALTMTVVALLFYAALFGVWIDSEMNDPDEKNALTQQLFDKQSSFSINRVPAIQGDIHSMVDEQGRPRSLGPTYPPPTQ